MEILDSPEGISNIKVFDNMPLYASETVNGMRVSKFKNANTFTDMFGRYVEMTLNSNNNKYYAEGYYRAAWDLRCRNLRLSEDGETLYRRDVDYSGNTRKLKTWHEVASIESEYNIPRAKQLQSWETFIRNQAEDGPKVRKGMRFGNNAYIRSEDGVHPISLDGNDDMAFIFCEENVETDKAKLKGLIKEAKYWVDWLTNGEHSRDNLLRMFATPFLEPYKHLTYVLYGGGGNGKGVLLGRMAEHYPRYASTFDTKRFADGKGFTAEQESRKIVGKYWLFDEEADLLDQNSMTKIKRLSTGEPVVARSIGENAITFKPKATLIVATNNPFVSAQTEASTRRFVFVRMKEGRSAKDFEGFIEFIDSNGIVPFLLASCMFWRDHGDQPWTDVSIGGESDMTDIEEWVRDCICANGYAISSDNPYGKRFPMQSRDKLGLKSTVKWVEGKTQRVLVVDSEKRFEPYREAYEHDIEEVEKKLSSDDFGDVPNVDVPLPGVMEVSALEMMDPKTYGFKCSLAPAESHGADQKKSYTWASSHNSDNEQERRSILNHCEAYAVIPEKGYVIIDLDMDHHDGPNGWDILNSAVGSYESNEFPSTFMVKTPSGGVHAYYRIPDKYRGKLKNIAHSAGIPIDLRLERKGYALGAESIIDNGKYELIDIPVGVVPELTPAMLSWFKDNGYFYDDEEKKAKINLYIPKSSAKDLPDMSAVPEGQRNQVLHDWCYGRLANHPENKEKIHDDLMERGRVSGLEDRELETIWGSITRQLGA